MTSINNPKVSIILPTYNGSKYIRQSIDSCLNQTFKDFELIIIDDCSTDATPEIIKSYNDPRIRYIRNQVNQRLPRSLNIGFAEAAGEYLTWTSDDNEFLPTAIEELLAFLQENKDIDFVYADMIVRYFETKKEILRKLFEPNLENENNVGACYLYTRKVYETIGGFDPNWDLVEDYDYWIRISQKFQIAHYPKALYIYGDHEHSLTTRKHYTIHMTSHILRYYNGYITLGELYERLCAYDYFIQKKFLAGSSELFGHWGFILTHVFRVSPAVALKFFLLLFCLVLSRLVLKVIRPFINVVLFLNKEWTFYRVIANIKSPSEDTLNILCSVQELVMGGSEKVMQDVVEGLKKPGIKFHLICRKKQNNQWCRDFRSCFDDVFLLDEEADSKVFARYLPKIIEKLNIKMILSTNTRQVYKCLPDLKIKFPDLKMVDIVHLERVGSALDEHVQYAPLFDRRISISHHLKKFIIEEQYKQAGMNDGLASRILVIHNGIDVNRFIDRSQLLGRFKSKYGISDQTKIITFVGRFSIEKRPLLFVESARKLIALAPPGTFKFVMAGTGPEIRNIKAKIELYQLQDSFILPGIVTSELPALLADTFLLHLFSDHEGIPLIIQEAMLMGVPAISTDVGAIYELIKDGENGFLVDFGTRTVDHFVGKTMKLVNNEALYKTMCRNARESILSEYSLTDMIQRYRQSLFEILGQKP